MVTKVDQSSDIKGHAKASSDDPMWKVYIYNQSKDSPKRLGIEMLKSEVKTMILANAEDPSGLAERWADLPKKNYSK